MALRFSTVIGGRDSSEAARDPRGFAIKSAAIQANDLGHASKDLYDAIERGDYPEWDLLVQMMDDHDHPELDWDPLDDTKVWPEERYEPKKVGTVALNRNVENFFAENEQISFGTGVLVDGLDFSDDKMLVGRTFSYSDTQRYPGWPGRSRSWSSVLRAPTTSRVAVVAALAQLVPDLAEQFEQRAAPAGGGLRVTAHHLYPAALQLPAPASNETSLVASDLTSGDAYRVLTRGNHGCGQCWSR